MQVSFNGHKITEHAATMPEFSELYRPICGERIITTCPQCQAMIQGHYISPGIFSGSDTPIANNCHNCGTTYPWRQAAIASAIEVLQMDLEGKDLGDVAMMPAPKMGLSPSLVPAPALTRPHDRELDELANLLNEANRVTLLCGRGCFGAHVPLMRLADMLKSPIVHALGGKEVVEWDNPFDVGMTGLIGFSSGYHAMMERR